MNENTKQLTDTDFDNLYTYNEDLISECFEEGSGQFETYGADLEVVLTVANGKHDTLTGKNVWTVVDGDEGVYIVSGYHLVNRINYIITNEECQTEEEVYLLDVFND